MKFIFKKIIILIICCSFTICIANVNIHANSNDFINGLSALLNHDDIADYVNNNFLDFVDYHNQHSDDLLEASYVEYSCEVVITLKNEIATYLDFNDSFGGIIFGDNSYVYYIDYKNDFPEIRNYDGIVYYDFCGFGYVNNNEYKYFTNLENKSQYVNDESSVVATESITDVNLSNYMNNRYGDLNWSMVAEDYLNSPTSNTKTQPRLSIYMYEFVGEDGYTYISSEGNCLLVAIYNLFCWYYNNGLTWFPVNTMVFYDPYIEEPDLVNAVLNRYPTRNNVIQVRDIPQLYLEIRDIAIQDGYLTQGTDRSTSDKDFFNSCIAQIFNRYYGYMSLYWYYSGSVTSTSSPFYQIKNLINNDIPFVLGVSGDEYYNNHSIFAYGYKQYKATAPYLVFFTKEIYLTFVKTHDGREDDAWLDLKIEDYIYGNERDTSGYNIRYAQKNVVFSGNC